MKQLSFSLRDHALHALCQRSAADKLAAVAAIPFDAVVDVSSVLHCNQPLPGRPAAPVLVPPVSVPRRKLATAEGRAVLVHALAHIEFNAINLALDIIWRFPGMPAAFYRGRLRRGKAHQALSNQGPSNQDELNQGESGDRFPTSVS